MSAEAPFQLAFVSGFAIALAVAATTTRRATRRHGGSLNQLSHEIPGLLFVRGALGVVFYAALFAWLLRPGSYAWAYVQLPAGVRWIGTGLLVPTLAFFAWSFRSLGTNHRGGVGLYDAHELVTTGAYQWMRHPVYVSFIGVMFLVLVISANWVLGLSGLLLVASIAAARIPEEERQLHARFGRAWERYRDRTGRLVPRIPV